MKAITVSIYIFVNLVVLGMFGYVYLLWSQYWSYLTRQSHFPSPSSQNIFDKQIYFYNHGYPNETMNENVVDDSSLQKYNAADSLARKRDSRQIQTKIGNDSVIVIKDSKPRFPNLQTSILQMDTNIYKCDNKRNKTCAEITFTYKNKLIMELQRIFMKESDIFKSGSEAKNPYEVRYDGPKGNYMKKASQELLCELKNSVAVKTVRRNDSPFKNLDLKKYIPKVDLFQNTFFNSCAVVASAGSLKNSNLGAVIDSHDLVLRFNHAPTTGYENDVGSKTTIRVLNSQVVTKPEFQFLSSHLYRNISVLIWDPCKYSASLEDWYRNPDYNLFPAYKQFREEVPRAKLYMLNPTTLWSIWDFLQRNSPNRLRKNPPSSGFLALVYLLQHCAYVDMFEYIPSSRITRNCHYYDVEDNPSCTFGAWHPLAAEKLVAYAMNVADDVTVFQKGYIRVPGFSTVHC